MIEDKPNFDWVPFFKELREKLRGYRNRQAELIKILQDAGAIVKEDEIEAGKKIPLTVMDPFTFASILCSYKKQRYSILRSIRKIFSIGAITPSTSHGLPSANAQNVWLFPYQYHRENDHIDTLWDLFEKAFTNQDISSEFNKLLKSEYRSVGKGKLTHGLFRFFAERYFPVDSKTIPYFKNEKELPLEFDDHLKYKELCDAIKKRFPEKSFVELSHEAHIYSIGRQKTEGIVFVYCDDPNKDKIELYTKHLKNTFIKDNVIAEYDEANIKNCQLAIILLFLNIDFTKVNNLLKSLEANLIPYRVFLSTQKYPLALEYVDIKKLDDIKVFKENLKKIKKKRCIEFSSDVEALEKINKFTVEGDDEEDDDEKKNTYIKLNSLSLSNIGVFNRGYITFDKKFTVIIGLNGTGKTTVLRTILFALIGERVTEYISSDEKIYVQQLLSFKEGTAIPPLYERTGNATLNFQVTKQESVDSVLTLESEANQKVDFSFSGESLLGEKESIENRKILVIGFGQQRGGEENESKLKRSEHLTRNYHNNDQEDFAPLLLNKEDKKIIFFKKWIKELNIQIREGYTDKRKLIDKCTEIFNKISENYIEITDLPGNSEIYIKTKNNETSERVVPILLSSQGYQYIMSFVGYLLMRMSGFYGEIENFNEKPAIVFFDEIDTNLHPQWLLRLPDVLQKYFPETQFIVTTHSPLILTNLRKEQIIHIRQNEKGKFNFEQEEANSYGMDINRLLNIFMDGTKKRNQSIDKSFQEIYSYIREKKWDSAKVKVTELEKEIDSDDPEFSNIKAMVKIGAR